LGELGFGDIILVGLILNMLSNYKINREIVVVAGAADITVGVASFWLGY